MDIAELKLKIFRQVDSLDQPKLEEFYGIMLNFLNSKSKPEEWTFLTNEQRAGLEEAIAEINEGKGIPHQTLVAEFRQKYGNQ